MSGRRRRGDGWDEGRRDANDDRRDPWADGGADDWTGRDRHRGEAADRFDSPAGSASGRGGRDGYRAAGGAQAGGYGRGGYDNLRYDAGSGRSQRDAANGYAAAGYNGNNGYAETGYASGRTAASDAYQGSGYGNNGYGAGGYEAAGYDATSYDVGYGGDASTGGYGNDAGYGAGANGVNGRSASGFVPEFTPVGTDDAGDGQPDTPRPIGRLSIYTLHDHKAAEFDLLAERAAEGVKATEPDTLVFVIHVVPKAPMQRIIYEIYRDRAAFESHERQPHIQQFAADCASCVLATNIIDLRLKYAKVAALGAMPSESPSRSQASWTPRALESAAPVASFTPAEDQYATVNGQYAANGREQYSQSAQYGNAGNGAYGTDNSQYGGTGAYSAATAAANGGYSAANGANGYPSSNGYSSGSGYSSANGYQGANGYPGANGYANGSGYANPAASSAAGSSGSAGYANSAGYAGAANGYANGTTGYANGAAGYANGSSAAGYANGSGAYANGGSAYASGTSYQNGSSYANGAGYSAAAQNVTGYSAVANGYGTAGYGESADGQYGTGRYRELPSGSEASSGAYSDGTGAYQNDRGRTRGQATEWDPRASQGQR
ncbi:MAG TPA: antibiotic biosynthesis monooxygenase [Trebonia sp.]|nr:antibiotic biosynthesis monooxygenase [Trebonia sp.]